MGDAVYGSSRLKLGAYSEYVALPAREFVSAEAVVDERGDLPTRIDGRTSAENSCVSSPSRAVMESCAILQYLAEKYPTPLMPLDEQRWDLTPWLHWQAANLGPAFGNRLSYARYIENPGVNCSPLERFTACMRVSGSSTPASRSSSIMIEIFQPFGVAPV